MSPNDKPEDEVEPADSKQSTNEMSREEIKALLKKHGVDADSAVVAADDDGDEDEADTDEGDQQD